MKKFSLAMLLFFGLFTFAQAYGMFNKEETAENVNQYIVSKIKYFKDTKTNLCFARIDYFTAISTTNVPCTPEVEKLLVNK